MFFPAAFRPFFLPLDAIGLGTYGVFFGFLALLRHDRFQGLLPVATVLREVNEGAENAADGQHLTGRRLDMFVDGETRVGQSRCCRSSMTMA